MKHTGKRLLAAALAVLLLASVWGCNNTSPADATEPGSTDSSSWLPSDSTQNTTTQTTVLPSTTAGTTKPKTTAKNINNKGNSITDDPKYVGNLADRKDEDPQYKPKPKPPVNTPDTLTTSPVATTKPTAPPTKPPTGSTTKPSTAPPPQGGWYESNGNTYFYNGGKPVTGWQSLNGFRYYFDSNGVLSSKVGLDVSEWNENLDWKKIKASGVDFVMIRVGFRGYGKAGAIRLDKMFKDHLQKASQAGLDCGVYFYTQAITTAEAREEAQFVLKAIEGFTLTYPIAFDIEKCETGNGDIPRTEAAKLNNTQRTDITLAFCDTIKKARYFPSVYANLDWLTNKLQASRLSGYDIWLAHYTSSLQSSYKGSYNMWQFTESGKVNGANGSVDCNISLRDYADYLKKNGWNKL